MEDNRTMKELADEAVGFAQSASNLSGLVYGFARAMKRLRQLEPDKDTDFYNKHPISVLYATQISFLTSCEDDGAYNKAYTWAKEQK